MSIIVTTGGPLGATTTETPFSDLYASIADDIDDTTGEYAPQIQRAVLAAIRYCEREVYYFNETRDVTFQTVDGQEWYGADAAADIPTLVHIEAIYSEDGSGQRSTLRREPPDEIERLSDNTASTGEPYAFTYFNRQLRLYPIPDARPYTIRLVLSPYRLGYTGAPEESSAWLTEAYDLVKARAKYILGKDTLKDAVLATEGLNDYNDQHDQLKAETSRRNGRGVIKATCF